MIRIDNHRFPRSGFTLIELLVSMALTLFIMLILTQAFTTSLDTFSRLKIVGEMQGQLRNVATILQADLAADHFEGKRRLSDWRQAGDAPWLGFFKVYQAAVPTVEGVDPDGIPSSRATQDLLYFTAKLRGPRQENYFAAPVGLSTHPLVGSPNPGHYFSTQGNDGMYLTGQSFNSQWAEVAYFLLPTHQSPDGVQLHALYRSQYVMVPAKENVTAGIAVTQAPNLAGNLPGGQYYAPRDVASRSGTVPATRTLNVTAAGGPRRNDAAGTTPPPGATLLLANVVSFHVQAQTAIDSPFTNASFDSVTLGSPVYALKITLRIWEEKGQSRQITILQDM